MTHYRDFGVEAPGPRCDNIFTEEFDTDTKVLEEVIKRLYARVAELEYERNEFARGSVVIQGCISFYEERLRLVQDGVDARIQFAVKQNCEKLEKAKAKLIHDNEWWKNAHNELCKRIEILKRENNELTSKYSNS